MSNTKEKDKAHDDIPVVRSFSDPRMDVFSGSFSHRQLSLWPPALANVFRADTGRGYIYAEWTEE